MSKKIFNSSNRVAGYIIIALVAIIVIMILGGTDWLRGFRINQSLSLNSINWSHTIISIGIGFGLGWLVFRKR
ncbi:hypothetical protein [Perlabentimonas gracilis]|uniref:hypothetical protein n=1 Tax=Perlabentimonas gracilis TaxID=2715279 RepID=UPI00140AB591|nr:hypothetical protein [Perlabentimonas gracilis]NHB68831.1 hypothetical protein [Perlabentimonas gracilis]